MEYILCLGDSLTFGARDEYHRSYPIELGRLYRERQGRHVYAINHGVSGETSSELLRRAYGAVRSVDSPIAALILIGTNDTFLPQPPEIYEDNIRQLVALSRSRTETVGIGLLPPIIGPGLPNYPRDGQVQVDRFNEILAAVAADSGCFVADFRGLGDLIIDTVHFGHAGYVRMAEIWYDALEAAVAAEAR